MIYTSGAWPENLITDLKVLKRPRGRRIGTNRRRYLDAVCAFDTETTTVREKYSVMWVWQLQIGKHDTIIGRTWKEFLKTVKRIKTLISEDDTYICVYVHNLAFEFQFLRGIYKFKPDEVFCVQPRKPLRVDMLGCVEFRCSYLHSNMRLETYLSKMGVEHQKLKMDYSKARYPWTPIEPGEMAYIVNDVQGLVEAITKEMEHDGDTLYTIPATSTGYVRRDVKKAMRELPHYYIKNLLPDFETFEMLREAFRGGNTHANRYFSKQIINDVKSIDMASCYPAAQMMDLFPVRPFRRVENCSFEKMEDLLYRRKKPLLMRLSFGGLSLKDRYWGCPYIPIDKCRCLTGAVNDNGRVLSADYLEISVTDLDYRIIRGEYAIGEIQIIDLMYSGYGPLPDCLKRAIKHYYTLKTELKGNDAEALLYEKSKNKLNAIYGMSCTNPAKRDILFVGGEKSYEFDGSKGFEEILEKSNKKAFFPYQWGVWTTANARMRLEAGIRIAHERGEYIYCDTDSVKYTGDIGLDELNAPIRDTADKAGAYADRGERRYHMGVWEEDDGYPARFATRGAKKYVVENPETGKLKATIAGVNKREDDGRVSGGMELMEHGGFSAFLADEFVFHKAASAKSIYNDHERFMVRVDGHRLKVRECVTITENTYVLKDTLEYSALLDEILEEEILIFSEDFFGKTIDR